MASHGLRARPSEGGPIGGRPTRRQWLGQLIWATFGWAGMPSSAWAHPDHVALAEVNYNAKERLFEVALRCKPEDLERALSFHAATKISLEGTQAPSLVQAYLRQTFRLRVGKRLAPLRWLGMEVTPRFAWLYFEMPAKLGLNGHPTAVYLSFDFLLDVEEAQANTATLRIENQRTSLRFRIDDAGEKAMVWPQTKND